MDSCNKYIPKIKKMFSKWQFFLYHGKKVVSISDWKLWIVKIGEALWRHLTSPNIQTAAHQSTLTDLLPLHLHSDIRTKYKLGVLLNLPVTMIATVFEITHSSLLPNYRKAVKRGQNWVKTLPQLAWIHQSDIHHHGLKCKTKKVRKL